MKQEACKKSRTRRSATALFNIRLGVIVPGPQPFEEGECGAPLLSDKEIKKGVCVSCTCGRNRAPVTVL